MRIEGSGCGGRFDDVEELNLLEKKENLSKREEIERNLRKIGDKMEKIELGTSRYYDVEITEKEKDRITKDQLNLYFKGWCLSLIEDLKDEGVSEEELVAILKETGAISAVSEYRENSVCEDDVQDLLNREIKEIKQRFVATLKKNSFLI